MKISNKISDAERHYINNLIQGGKAEVPDKHGSVSPKANYMFVLEEGFIIGAKRIFRVKKLKD